MREFTSNSNFQIENKFSIRNCNRPISVDHRKNRTKPSAQQRTPRKARTNRNGRGQSGCPHAFHYRRHIGFYHLGDHSRCVGLISMFLNKFEIQIHIAHKFMKKLRSYFNQK